MICTCIVSWHKYCDSYQYRKRCIISALPITSILVVVNRNATYSLFYSCRVMCLDLSHVWKKPQRFPRFKMSLFLTLIIIVYRNETSYLSYICLCQVITRTSSFSNILISSLNLSDQLSDTLALKKTGVYCYTTVLLVFVCASACDKFLSNFSQQQMYTFLSFGRLIHVVLKKLLPFVTL